MSKRKTAADSDMLPEYDFSAGVRGKHARRYERGHTVMVRKPREYFSDSDSVNQALRTLIELIQQKRRQATRK